MKHLVRAGMTKPVTTGERTPIEYCGMKFPEIITVKTPNMTRVCLIDSDGTELHKKYAIVQLNKKTKTTIVSGEWVDKKYKPYPEIIEMKFPNAKVYVK